MAKKQLGPHTPDFRIRSMLRQLWLRSRERAEALKRDKYTCQECGKKQSKAKGKECKVAVHHVRMIQWSNILKYVREELLSSKENLITLCKHCHDSTHYGGSKE